MSKSAIFKQAWALAAMGAVRFGGKKSEYFAESLKIVYAKDKVYVLLVQTSRNRPAWCAKITGLSKRYGLQREFLGDYGLGHWDLTDGIYNYGRGKGDSHYIIVKDGNAQVTYDDDVKLVFA